MNLKSALQEPTSSVQAGYTPSQHPAPSHHAAGPLPPNPPETFHQPIEVFLHALVAVYPLFGAVGQIRTEGCGAVIRHARVAGDDPPVGEVGVRPQQLWAGVGWWWRQMARGQGEVLDRHRSACSCSARSMSLRGEVTKRTAYRGWGSRKMGLVEAAGEDE